MKFNLFAACFLILSGISHVFGAEENSGPWELANPYMKVSGENHQITSLAFDPAGKAQYAPNFLSSFTFYGINTDASTVWEKTGPDSLTVTGLVLQVDETLECNNGGLPEQLPPGMSFGQTFQVKAGTFNRISIPVPTWNTDDSAVTLRLLREGPGGEEIASARYENLQDNKDQSLEFAPQPPGTYYIEISDALGTPGWWGTRKDEYADGTAYTNGNPVPERDRGFTVEITRVAGPAQLNITLDENNLIIAADLLEGAEAQPLPVHLVMPWKNTGYEVSASTMPFYRFYTNNQRYMPSEQLKRRNSPGLEFGPCEWIEADGTRQFDLRITADSLGCAWEMEDSLARLNLSALANLQENDIWRTEMTLTGLPREDKLPEAWPSFDTPDPELTADLNRFFYERAMTYPGPSGPGAWMEWSALIRSWFAGPLRDGEAANLRATPISDEGYVHTWGGSAGWPFPDTTVYDTRHFDTNARFILGIWRNACWSRNEEYIRTQAERLRKAMEYQLNKLHGEDGLIISASKDVNGRHKGIGNNYWDILPFGHLDAYANAVYYASLEAMAQLEEIMAQYPDIITQTSARSPEYYRNLMPQVKQAYTDTFWDEAAGRFIGCVDIDGKRHDYGFTFVNLEAMAYGLASTEQAKRIYDWMENGITSSGEADTYTRWIFAPRANTIHNPMWNEDGINDPDANGVEPWWHFGWRGTRFDEQCQDGGAILYTSFFDLMARTQLLGPDNAWQRWQEILERYREPDRLCGGPPLYHGEIPQQENPGSVGLDLPFPESGLVPTWFMYGCAGISAQADGLHIAPNLPSALPWVVVRNISYRGLKLDIYVNTTEVSITSTTPGYEFIWTQNIPAAGEVIFRTPPAPVNDFPSVIKVTGIPWYWLWSTELPTEGKGTVWYRKTFNIDELPQKAIFAAAADNYGTVYMNGKRIGKTDGWERMRYLDVTENLVPGENVIAMKLDNVDGPGGFLGRLALSSGKDSTFIYTDSSWRATATEPADNWTTVEFNASGWQPASELGIPPADPWGTPADPGF